MRVGVILFVKHGNRYYLCIPHASGGDPEKAEDKKAEIVVFPMRVGVIPQRHPWITPSFRIPHASGGDPRLELLIGLAYEYSPCEWG